MSRLFSYCRIGCQIALLGLMGLIGMAGIEAIHWWGTQRTNASHALVADARAIVLLQETLQVNMLQARRHEKDLQLRRDEASATKHAGAMRDIARDLKALQDATAGVAQAQSLLERTTAAVGRYGEQFKVLHGVLVELGLDENKGLQGGLRSAIREVESRTAKVGALTVQVSILMLRRHEKDFLARDEARYVTQLQAELPKLAAALDGAGIAAAERAELDARIAVYRDSFLRLVDGRVRLAKALSELSRAYAEVETQLDSISVLFTKAAEEETARGDVMVAQTRQISLSVAGGLALVVSVFAWWIGRQIARPVVAVTAAMQGLVAGRLDTALPQDKRHDELGQMIHTLIRFRDGLAETERLRQGRAAERERAQAEKQAAMQAMAEQIEADASRAVTLIGERASQMSRVAEEMRVIAEHSRGSARAASQASDQALANSQTVASATQELVASIREIGEQVNQSTTVVTQAVAATDDTRSVIAELNDRAGQIGVVVEMITEIAGRTNLLALNATIEAARAGEAGKGFAVVANEVKQLATQTARSTDEITRHISGVRAATEQAVASMSRIDATIGNVSSIASSIASAVEQQGAATAEIARAVSETSMTVQEMAARNSDVVGDAERSDSYAGEVLDSVAVLTGALQDLQETMVRTVRNSSSEVNRRSSPRYPVDLAAMLDMGGPGVEVRVVELSEGGAQVSGAAAVPVGRRGTLRINGNLMPITAEAAGVARGNVRLKFQPDEATRKSIAALLPKEALPAAA
jgi:methyl-accepting chemotaxis protein